MRVLIETFHIVIGVAAAVLIASLARWAYPQAEDDIWIVAGAMMVAIVAMGVRPLLAAYAADREKLHGTDANG